MSKPENYPLPWDDVLDIPWWRLNLHACRCDKYWVGFQKNKNIPELIPVLKWRLFR